VFVGLVRAALERRHQMGYTPALVQSGTPNP
jgi:hypothetical protein